MEYEQKFENEQTEFFWTIEKKQECNGLFTNDE